jgi:hypothetical protein
MGQLISSQGGKRSRNELNVPRPAASVPTKVEFESSAHYSPHLKTDLENGDFDLTGWEPQQLITTYGPTVVHRAETPRGQANSSFSSLVSRKHQTTARSDSIKIIEQIDEKESGLSSGGRIILDEDGFTHSPIDLVDSRLHERNVDKQVVARNLSARSRTQHDRKVLMSKVHRLLHSASLDDISKITSYLKTHEDLLISDRRHFFKAIDIC